MRLRANGRVAVLALVLIGLASAQGTSFSADSRSSSRVTLHVNQVIMVFATNISGARNRKPPAGIKGDVIVGSDRLRNAIPQFGKPKRAVVGRDRYRSVFQSASVAIVESAATLPGGTIRARGRADFRQASNVIRVIGGTGVFEGVRGTAEQRVLQKDLALNIYRLRSG